MIYTQNEKLRACDLSYDFKDYLGQLAKKRIKDDPELMKHITEQVEEGEKGYPKSEFTVAKNVDLILDDIVLEAVESVRIYCEFDLEFSL